MTWIENAPFSLQARELCRKIRLKQMSEEQLAELLATAYHKAYRTGLVDAIRDEPVLRSLSTGGQIRRTGNYRLHRGETVDAKSKSAKKIGKTGDYRMFKGEKVSPKARLQ